MVTMVRTLLCHKVTHSRALSIQQTRLITNMQVRG
jgi:hypothetical protein